VDTCTSSTYFEALTDLTATGVVRRVAARWNRPGLRGEIVHELLPHDLALLMVLLGGPLGVPHVLVHNAQRLEIDLVTAQGVPASLRYSTDAARPRLAEIDAWSETAAWWSPGRLDETRYRRTPTRPVTPADLRLDHTSTPVEREVAGSPTRCLPGDRMVSPWIHVGSHRSSLTWLAPEPMSSAEVLAGSDRRRRRRRSRVHRCARPRPRGKHVDLYEAADVLAGIAAIHRCTTTT
jgi:hypothetical protein